MCDIPVWFLPRNEKWWGHGRFLQKRGYVVDEDYYKHFNNDYFGPVINKLYLHIQHVTIPGESHSDKKKLEVFINGLCLLTWITATVMRSIFNFRFAIKYHENNMT